MQILHIFLIPFSKFSLYDPSDLLANNLKGEPAYLVFYTDTVQYTNISYTFPSNTDPQHSKDPSSKIYHEKISPYFAFGPVRSYSIR
jgi:hypothetical protein